MNIAILVQCHRYTDALYYTVKKLASHPQVKVYIHLDKKSSSDQILEMEGKNVSILKNRIDISWGNISQFKATTLLVKAALVDGFDYASLISGDDVFVGKVTDFIRFLEQNNNKEFFGIDERGDNIDDRVKYSYPAFFYVRDKSFLKRLSVFGCKVLFKLFFFKNPLFHVLPKLYKGSCWFTLSSSCLSAVISYLDENKLFFEAFSKSYCGDEIILQTILIDIGTNSRRYIPKNCPEDDNLASLRCVDWVSGPDYPKILGKADFNKIIASGCFFARKISSDIGIDGLHAYFD